MSWPHACMRRMPPENRARRLLLMAVLLLTTSCRATVRSAATEAPRAAVPVVVDETLRAAEDLRTRERVARVLATPEVHQAIAELARAAVAAALESASTTESEHVAELTNVVTRAIARTIGEEIMPAIMTGARDPSSATVWPDQRVIQRAVASVAAESTSAALRAAAKEIPTTVGPAVRESLARELRAPDLRDALASLIDDATRQVLVSSRDVVASAAAEDAAAGKPGLLQRIRRWLTLSWVLAFALGVAAVALGAWILRMRRRTKRYRGALLEVLGGGTKDAGTDEHDRDPARVQRLLELLQ
jgi:hypothetical protein